MHTIYLITNNYIGNTSVFTEVNETIRFLLQFAMVEHNGFYNVKSHQPIDNFQGI